MRKTLTSLLTFLFLVGAFSQSPSGDSLFIRKIFDVALTNGSAYTNLKTLCAEAPARLSGSENAAKAVNLTLGMIQQVADTAWLQETMVPHWERGEKEEGKMIIGNITTDMNL